MIGAPRPLSVRSRGIVGGSFLTIWGRGQWEGPWRGCPSGGDASGSDVSLAGGHALMI